MRCIKYRNFDVCCFFMCDPNYRPYTVIKLPFFTFDVDKNSQLQSASSMNSALLIISSVFVYLVVHYQGKTFQLFNLSVNTLCLKKTFPDYCYDYYRSQ